MGRPTTSFRPPLSMQVAVSAGFTVVLGLWLFSGYQLVHSLRDIEERVSVAHAAYVRGEQTLLKVRTNVLLGSIYLRDAVIDGGSSRRESYRAEFARLKGEIEQQLAAYVPDVASPVERDQWARLRVELADFWASREIAFTEGEFLTASQAAALLRSRVVPRRETIIQVLDQLGALQSVANRRHQQETELLHEQVRRRLITTGAITLFVALVVAFIASRHVDRLQHEIERQRLSEQRNREDLERLSARLVDAQEEERRVLARELHDEVGQALTAVKMDIGIALRTSVEPRVKSALEEARDIAETTLHGVRDLSQLLHPSMLDDFGLPATLTAYLRKFSDRTGIRAQLAETVDDRLVPQIEVAAYRIVQEALSNVASHSGATACTVSLGAGVGLLRIVVEDNGRGLGPRDSVPARRGLGLIGMRERAQSLGGTFAIENREGGGTRIEVALPFHQAADPDAEDQRKVAG